MLSAKEVEIKKTLASNMKILYIDKMMFYLRPMQSINTFIILL